jgi:hypothetical protein
MAKGHKTGGRKRGTPNKRTAELRDVIREHMPSAVTRLLELTRSDDDAVALAACKEIFDRGWGKPAQAVIASVNPPGGKTGFHDMWVALTTGKFDEARA